MRSWNVVNGVALSRLRSLCAVWAAVVAIAVLAPASAAQEIEYQGPLPPYGEADAFVSDGGPFVDEGMEELPGAMSNSARSGGASIVTDGPPTDYYYPPGAAEAGMPVAMPSIMPGDGDVPWHSFGGGGEPSPPPCVWCVSRLGFRHSFTHGRNVGWGRPLRGTSWLNRPYYVGFAVGPMWLTSRPIDSVERDKDVIGSVFLGWDWDYYWGSELLYSYATPELRNNQASGRPRSDRLAHWNYSFMYYPWGDSAIRPYWRFGIGDTKFDFPTDSGQRRDEWLLSTPFGVGLKHSVRRWLATRVEFTDQLSWGSSGIATQHNLTLTFGLEYHFGGHRKSYWPWNPSNEFW